MRSATPVTTTATAAAAARKLYFPSGRAPTVATKLFIAFGGPSSTGAGPAWPGSAAREPVTPGPLRAGTDSLVRRLVGRGTGQRVSDPFGDGSSSLDYICHVAGTGSQHQQRRMCCPIDTHPSLSRRVPTNLASFYRAVSKASQ